MEEQAYIDAVREICVRRGASRVVLFGSRARGTNFPHSDFDFAVFGLNNIRDIVDEIDMLPTLYSSDVVNMNTCKNKALIEEVEQNGFCV